LYVSKNFVKKQFSHVLKIANVAIAVSACAD